MDTTPRMGPLLVLLAGFLVLSAPLVLYIWHELGELMLGRVHPFPLAVATGFLVVFLSLAGTLAHHLKRLHGDL